MYTVDEVCDFLKDYSGYVEAKKMSNHKCILRVLNGEIDDYLDYLEYDDEHGEIHALLGEGALVNNEPLDYEFSVLWDFNDDDDNSIKAFVIFLLGKTASFEEMIIRDIYHPTLHAVKDFINTELKNYAK